MKKHCEGWWACWSRTDAELSGGDEGVLVYTAVRHVPPLAGFDGLSLMVEHIIRCNPFSGHLFVFCNPARAGQGAFLQGDADR